MSPAQVVVIGAGPGGLAAAAALGARGVQALVVDRDSQVGSSWRRHYERLHLHNAEAVVGPAGLPDPTPVRPVGGSGTPRPATPQRTAPGGWSTLTTAPRSPPST